MYFPSIVETMSIFPMVSFLQQLTGDTRTCAIFIPAWGSNWGSSGFFFNQNNCGLSGAYVTGIYCSLGTFVLRLFLHVWSAKNPKTPTLSPMADDAITRGSIRGLGSPVYIYMVILCTFFTTSTRGTQSLVFHLIPSTDFWP